MGIFDMLILCKKSLNNNKKMGGTYYDCPTINSLCSTMDRVIHDDHMYELVRDWLFEGVERGDFFDAPEFKVISLSRYTKTVVNDEIPYNVVMN